MAYKSYSEREETVKCRICSKNWEHLGSHIYHAHGLKAREYKIKFSLDYALPLISQKVRLKKQEHFKKHSKKYLSNLTKNHLIKKGEKLRDYHSEQSKKRYREFGFEYWVQKNTEVCPICKVKFKNLHSHLGEKHNLKVIL